MNESSVSRKLREALVSLGGVCWKTSDRFHASRPDLLFILNTKTSYIEVKVHPNKPTPLQALTLNELYSVGAPAYIATYYPADKSFMFESLSGIQTLFTDIRKAAIWLSKQHS